MNNVTVGLSMKCQYVTSEIWWMVGQSLRTVLSKISMSMSVLLLNEYELTVNTQGV